MITFGQRAADGVRSPVRLQRACNAPIGMHGDRIEFPGTTN